MQSANVEDRLLYIHVGWRRSNERAEVEAVKRGRERSRVEECEEAESEEARALEGSGLQGVFRRGPPLRYALSSAGACPTSWQMSWSCCRSW